MKKFLAVLFCFIIMVGCGKADDGLKMGSYVFDGSEGDVMPSILLKEDNTFGIIYKGSSANNMEGTFTLDEENNILTLNVVDENSSEAPVYTFQVEDDAIVFRNIGMPLPLYGDKITSTELPDNSLFVNADSETETETEE